MLSFPVAGLRRACRELEHTQIGTSETKPCDMMKTRANFKLPATAYAGGDETGICEV